MKTRLYGTLVLAIFISALAFAGSGSCKKAAEEAPGKSAKRAAAPARSGEIAAGDEAAPRGVGEERGLAGHFIAPMDLARERLLEYRVDLTYESKDLASSRRKILGAAANHGFVNKSTASLEYDSPYVISELYVKSNNLYKALEDLDAAGVLVAENISVTDHTEEMVLKNQIIRREQLRIARKNGAAVRIAPAAKNWNEIENSLSRSEDRLDESEHARWKIRDKVSWSLIRVTLRVPDQPTRIVLPRYTDAFIGLANILLKLIYALIYLFPLAALAALMVWKRKQLGTIFGALFRRKKTRG